MAYLIDLSAWARSGHLSAQPRWTVLLEADHLRCHPVFEGELLHNAVTSTNYTQLSLHAVVPRAHRRGFVWLCAVRLTDGTRIDAFAHTWTRRQLLLGDDGAAFAVVA